MNRPAALFASCASGVLLGFLVRVNAGLGEAIGMLEATFVVHAVGTAFALLLVARRLSIPFARQLADARYAYELTGGFFGVAMVFLSNVIVSRLGVALGVSLFIAADLTASAVADRVGLMRLAKRRLTWRRVLGLALAVAGVLVLRWS